MKRSLFLLLALAPLGAAAPKSGDFAPVKDLGNIMYVGDSITHGVAAASYRWPLFKIWVDNGIAQKEVGVHSRNHSGGVQPGTTYGTATFLNVHSAISSERAYEIAGRINKSGRLENSNIYDWLGLDESYKGQRRIDPEVDNPASYIMMIGTNDTLSDAGNAGIHSCLAEKAKNLLGKGGDMDTIVKAMRRANPKARIAVTTIPTWAPGRNNNAAPEDFAAIEHYNEKLKAWGKANKVSVLEVNCGMVDVSDERAFIGLPAMFGRDKLHPSPHGDLIIAGNIARQLGYAGRTAGLRRKAITTKTPEPSAASGVSADKAGCFSFSRGGGSVSYAGADSAQGATVEFSFPKGGYGNGAKGGWEKDKVLELTLGSGSSSGTLIIDESQLRWGNTTLYSADMSKMRDRIRLAQVPGAPAQGVQPGFYLWLGDMLIGEALPGTAGGESGVTLRSGGAAHIAGFSYEPAAAWAPLSKRFSAGNPTFSAESSPAAGDTGAAKDAARTIDTPQREALRLMGGNGQDNITVTLSGQASAPTKLWNALCVGTLPGSSTLTVAADYAGRQAWGPFFASANSPGIGGNATLTVNSDAFCVKAGKFGAVFCALAGTFDSSVKGEIAFVLNKGRYEGDIYGGAIGRGATTIGSTRIELGEATVTGKVCAGGTSGIIAGDATLVLREGAKVASLSGGKNVKGARKLVLDKVTTAPTAALADFDEVHVTNGSVVILSSLGGAKKLIVDATSRLTLAPGSYEASVLNSGSIVVLEGCTLSLRPEGTDENETGTYTVKGTLKANNVRMSNDIRIEGGQVDGLGDDTYRGKLTGKP